MMLKAKTITGKEFLLKRHTLTYKSDPFVTNGVEIYKAGHIFNTKINCIMNRDLNCCVIFVWTNVTNTLPKH